MNNTVRTGLLLVSLLLAIPFTEAQETKFYDIPGFLKLAGSSEKKYEFALLEEAVEPIFDFGRLNFNYYYLTDSAGKRVVHPYQIEQEYRELYEWAGEGIMIGIPDTAILLYEEILEVYPRYSPALSGIGQAWQQLDNHTEAIKWFRKAIAMNPIDYMAWWGLALSYDAVNFKDSASMSITTAWILNRNSSEIYKEVKRIYASGGFQLLEWSFVPQVEMWERDGKIHVVYDPSWMGYAICQAIWKHEPGFELQRQIPGDVSMFRERECLSCLLTSILANEQEAMKQPTLQAFKIALQEKFTLEFLLFEILLPEKPDMAYLLDAKRVEKMIEYIYATHRTPDEKTGR